MRSFRTALLSRASELYKTIVVPLVIFGVIASIGVEEGKSGDQGESI